MRPAEAILDETSSPVSGPETPSQEDSSSALPNSVKVRKQFSLPGIGFCVAMQPLAPIVHIGLSSAVIQKADLSAENIEASDLGVPAHTSYVTGLVRCGETLISGGYDCSLIWRNADSGDVTRTVTEAHSRWIRMLAASPDQTRIVSVGDDMRTRLWDASVGECLATWGDYELKTIHGFPSMLYAVTFSPDGKWIATGDRTGRVLVRDATTGEIASTLETPVMYTWDPKARRHSIGGIRSLAFSHNSTQLAVGGMGQVGNIDHLEGVSRVEVFEWQSGARRFEIEDSKHKGLVEALHFGPGDTFLVAAGGDQNGFVSVYSMADGKLLTQDKAPMHVHDFQLMDDGRALVAVGYHQGAVIDLFG